ncbi:phosphodiester glycosidase family protein [Aquirufa antheringensis]
MAGFKEKPKMSSGGGLGQNFRKLEDNSSSKGKRILYILLVVLAIILIIIALSDEDKKVGSGSSVNKSSSNVPEYIIYDNYNSSDGNQYAIFKVKLSKELESRVYLERNLDKRNVTTLLYKISRDKLTKTGITNSLFKDEAQFFAITAAMFENDDLPPGLLVSGSKKYKKINLSDGGGNFYLKPNGIFSISNDGQVNIQETQKFDQTSLNSFAIQSGPMLVIDNKLNHILPNDSPNVNIRTAVGLNDDGLVFVISKSEVNFFQLAEFMKTEMKCSNALHLDSGAFAFMDFPGGTFKNSFKSDTEIRNLIVIR